MTQHQPDERPAVTEWREYMTQMSLEGASERKADAQALLRLERALKVLQREVRSERVKAKLEAAGFSPAVLEAFETLATIAPGRIKLSFWW